MRVNRLVSIVILIASLSAVSASGARTNGCSPCAAPTVAVAGSNLLTVRLPDARGLRVYDLAAGRLRSRLPDGLLSADGRTLVSARINGGRTTFERYDVPTGRRAARWSVRGRFATVALAPSGRRIAAYDVARTGRGVTVVGLIADRKTAVRRVVLRGREGFGVEALSNNGRKLFVLEYRRVGYVVQVVDVATGRRVNLRPKGEPALMRGAAGTALPTPDGRRLLTLFLGHHGSAIHALDLARAKAVCIDLPAPPADELRAQYGFVPNGRGVVAVNPALGTVVRVDLERSRVVSVLRFAGARDAQSATVGAVSRDGRTLYFGAGRRVWAYDAAYARVRGPYWPGGTVAGLGFSPDDRKLRVIRADGRLETLVAATGREATDA